MTLFTLDIAEIGDLGTQVAVNGSIAMVEQGGDALFELIVGIAILIYEMYPG